MNLARATQTGMLQIDSSGHKVYFERYGTAGETLLVLHGGPGGNTNLMKLFGTLATPSLQVVMWDQLGGGRSDRPDDDSLWTVDRFVEEVEAVRTGLNLGRVHLLGQSWGGMLSLSYVLAHPNEVKSLILQGTPLSAPLLLQSISERRIELGPQEHMELLRHEAAGEIDEESYVNLIIRLHAKVTRRSTPYDQAISEREFRELVLPELESMGRVYQVMWGKHSFQPTGNLLTWDVSDRLSEIKVPTLILCGAHDAITPAMHALLAEGIEDSRFVIFGQSSHIINFEREADVCLDVIAGFLRRAIRVGTDRQAHMAHLGETAATVSDTP